MEILEQAEKLPVEKIDDDLVEVVSAPPAKKARKNAKPKPPKVVEDDDRKRNWLDSEVEALIALKGDMQPEFNNYNANKQDVDMWLKLHSRLVCLQPNFKKTPKACKRKFIDIYKAYEDDKHTNNISGEARRACKFYSSMDTWFHHSGSIVKHVSATSSDTGCADGGDAEVKVEDSESTTSFAMKHGKVHGKLKYQDQALSLMSQYVENMKGMAGSMKVYNGFLSNLDKHMEKLIEKL